jgi:hypothetical protein
VNAGYFVIGLIAALIAAAVLIPSNTLTGHVVKEKSCGSLGCSELCDPDGPNSGDDACSGGTVCCATHWQAEGKSQGVCDYSTNCERIREYSLYQSLEQYQDSVREKPSEIDASWARFFLPLVLCFGIVGYFVLKRNE